jgi:ABC-2 type transport system permease protein
MRNVWLVAKHEILTTIGKKSFWFMTFFFPLLIMAFSLFPSLFARDMVEQAQSLTGTAGVQAVGYVDQAAIIVKLPAGLPPGRLRGFATEAAAKRALDAGEIDRYYVIMPDFRQTGAVVVVSGQSAPVAGEAQDFALRLAINTNLTGDERLALAILTPAQIEMRSLAPEVKTQSTSVMGFVLPFAVMFILFFVITMSGGYMLQSVAKEKENRTAEVLLLSISPRELMLGKVLGLGAVALAQMTVWLGGGLVLMSGGLVVASLAAGQPLRLGFFLLAFAYFLLGYFLYASLLGAVGALAPTAREGAQFTFIIILPLLVPFYLNQAFTSDPNSVLVTALSLIPFSAPTAMMARLSVVAVPSWQIALSLGGLAVTTYLLVLLAARFFRADNLLSHASLNWGRLIREVRGRGTV